MNPITQQQLVSHIAAWSQIPASLTMNSPISHSNSNGLGLRESLTAFASEVRSQEGALLRSLGVDQKDVDRFMERSNQYKLLFLQLRPNWVAEDPFVGRQVLQDMDDLGTALRSLENELKRWEAAKQIEEEEGPLTIGRQTTHLRRLIASRAGFAEEILSGVDIEPMDAISIFFDKDLRLMRQLNPLTGSLQVYHGRRPSLRPLSPA